LPDNFAISHSPAAAVAPQTLHANASILNIQDAQEEEFVRLKLLFAGFFGETYT
jgi:hypothetical protein